MRILIAEDETISRMVLQKLVTRLGHEVIPAADGRQAWERFLESNPEVVISDWMMPDMDGLELCRRIREEAEQSGRTYTWFIMLTSLDQMQHRIEGMEAGADDYLSKPLDQDELQLRLIAARRVVALHQRIAEQTRQLEELNRRLYDDGRVDALTGVANRRRMEEDLRQLAAEAERYGHPWSVALMDIDHFKKYNDTLGHQAGDQTLRAVAQALAGACRDSDRVYRYGGEEFLVLLRQQWPDAAAVAAERLRQAVACLGRPHPASPHGHVTVSVGVAGWTPGCGLSPKEVIAQADEALYHAKECGRNRVVQRTASEGAAEPDQALPLAC